MSDQMQVTRRETRGKRGARRLREQGSIPAILYGHGEASVSLSIPATQVMAVLRHGGRVVELKGDIAESAMIREVQWDPYGIEVLHVDLARVSASEQVTAKVPVELRGEAPGVRQGGVVEHLLHEIEIRCPAASLPDKLQISINGLQLGQHLSASDVKLPEGATLVTPADSQIVHCVDKVEMEIEEATAEAGEPEVIGRKAAADEEGEE